MRAGRISIVRIALACLLVAVAAAARADTTPGEPPSRADAALPLTIDVAGNAFVDAQLWEGHARFNWDKQVEVLAVRTSRGWWVAPVASFWGNRWNSGEDSGIAVDGVARARRDGRRDDEVGRIVITQRRVAIGVEPSGAPTMTAPVDLAVETR